MKRFVNILVLLLLILLPVFAWGAPKRGEIIRADYGAGNNWVDVTQQVRSLIRGDALNFRVDNATLGEDPAPGEQKALRLEVRDKNGRTRQLTYQENQYVRLRGYSAGNTTFGGLQILRGVYGVYNRSVDVTSRLNSEIRGGRLNLQVTNGTMGGDPAPGQSKTLTVQYRYNGRQSEVVVNEGDDLNLPDGNTAYSGLQILRGVYGAYNRSVDVTNRLNSEIRGGRLNLQVTNDTMGGDPAPGERKTLTVRYRYDGRQSEVVVNEGDDLNLPDGNTAYSGLQILRGVYGAYNRSVDVTNRLNSEIRGGRLNLQVTNDTMGGDPAPGQRKTLTVQYRYNGRQSEVAVNEGNDLNLPDGNTASSGLQILRGVYGAHNRSVDVTSRLNSEIRRGRLNLQVTNDTMGGDPAPGQSKTLRVQYRYNGRQSEVAVNEGDDLNLPDGTGTSGAYTIIPSGTQLSIRTNEVIDSKTARAGQQFSAVMAEDVRDRSGAVAIPRGSDVALVIRSTEGSGLVLDIDSLVVRGERYVVSTADLQEKGRQGVGANKRTAEMVGGGAVLGALIGAVVGGGRGAAIGAAVGAAGGAGAEVLTKGKEVRVPAETVLNFRLDSDLRLGTRNW